MNATTETDEAASGVVGWMPVGQALVVPAAAAAAGTESVVVVVDDPFSSLEFRVLTNWFNYGKVFAGLPSPSSSSLRPIVFCAGQWRSVGGGRGRHAVTSAPCHTTACSLPSPLSMFVLKTETDAEYAGD